MSGGPRAPRLAAIVVGVVAAGVAAARPRGVPGLRGSGSLALEIAASAARATDLRPAPLRAAAVGFDARAAAGLGWPVLYAAGLGYRAGVSDRGGFAYRVEVLPIGVAVARGGARLAVIGGAALDGVTGEVPAALLAPVEAQLDLGLGPAVRLSVRARAAWVAGPAARRDGARHAPFGDEARAELALRGGRTFAPRRLSGGEGIYLAVRVGQAMGGAEIGAAIGYAVDLRLAVR